MDPEHIFQIFFAVWIFLGIGGVAFFYLNKNVKLKRTLLPICIVSVCIIFVGFIYLMMGSVPFLFLIFIPIIALLNLKMIRFCESCGATLISQNVFSPPKYCQKCGAKF
jgi:peptidoglycan/LPS O-acetylase OafA/YrhL